MTNVKKENEKKLEANADTRVWLNYFDNIKSARSFAAKNDSKVERVLLDSSRQYLVRTNGVGIR